MPIRRSAWTWGATNRRPTRPRTSAPRPPPGCHDRGRPLMGSCRITCADGGTIDVRGALGGVVEALHRVFPRREHTFAILHDLSGTAVAVRPEAVLHVRPRDAVVEAPPGP